MLPLRKPAPYLSPRLWFCAALLAGIAWRIVDLLLNFPIWGDESALLLNVMDRTYTGLLQPLAYGQVAPILYLFSLKWIFLHLGSYEIILRIGAFIPALLAIPLFYRLARSYGSRYAPFLATALLTCSVYPVRFSAMVKPYALDLLISTALLLIATRILKNPKRIAPALAFALLAPCAFFFSYPAIFIIAPVAIVILPSVFRRGNNASRFLLGFAGCATIATFLLLYNHIGQGQFQQTRDVMEHYWKEEFPPLDYTLPWWLLRSHLTGMMSYPIAGKYGSALLIFPLSLLGALRIWRHRSRSLALLLLLPFFFTFLASIPHRYPYGGAARIEQHLAPCIFLLAAHGFMALLSALSSFLQHRLNPALTRRNFLPCAVTALLVFYTIFSLINIYLDIRKPYIAEGPRDVRLIVRQIFTPDTPPEQQCVVFWNGHIEGVFSYYLRTQPHLPAPRGTLIDKLGSARVDESLLRTQSTGQLWLIAMHPDPAPILDAQYQQLLAHGFKLSIVEHKTRRVAVGNTEKPFDFAETLCLKIDGPPTPSTNP